MLWVSSRLVIPIQWFAIFSHILAIFAFPVPIYSIATSYFICQCFRFFIKIAFAFFGLFDHSVWEKSNDPLHHRQVFSIVVRLKHADSHVPLKDNTSHRPNVAWMRPAKFQNHFRWTIVSCSDYTGFLFVFECCGTKIDENYCWVADDFYRFSRSGKYLIMEKKFFTIFLLDK